MGKKYILYNPISGDGGGKSAAELIALLNFDSEIIDILEIGNYSDFFSQIDQEDDIVLCGGDGTLNHFVNDTKDLEIENDIYLYASGSGNDFARDLGKSDKDNPDYRINDYLKDLPKVTVNGKERLFLNGIGYGIDGYCCQVGDELREKNKNCDKPKPINYTTIAIKGLLSEYTPTNAYITIDGKHREYKDVWLAPTMNGRYYGGGMMPAPMQKRLNGDGLLTLMVFHSRSKIRTLAAFPSLFKGEHINHTDLVAIHRGKEITVEFDRLTPLQIDGETILNVSSYTAAK